MESKQTSRSRGRCWYYLELLERELRDERERELELLVRELPREDLDAIGVEMSE